MTVLFLFTFFKVFYHLKDAFLLLQEEHLSTMLWGNVRFPGPRFPGRWKKWAGAVMEKFCVLVGESWLNQSLLIIFVFWWLHTCHRHSLKHFSRLFMYTENFISLECLEGISSTMAPMSTFKDELIRFWRSTSRTLFCGPQSKNFISTQRMEDSCLSSNCAFLFSLMSFCNSNRM